MGDIIIPRSITYEGYSFIVTNIEENAFKYSQTITSIQFPADSEIKYINWEAFNKSSIEKVTIPPRVKNIEDFFGMCDNNIKHIEVPANYESREIDNIVFSNPKIEKITIPSNINLRGGWCYRLKKLTKVTIFPNGPQNIKYYDDRYIISKLKYNSDNYDNLVFVRRDLKTVEIPPFITVIGENAFSSSMIEEV